ncbi:MAG: M23 family metallopeptidase [Pseudomonadota bacterium]
MALAALPAAATAQDDQLRLNLPVDCTLGEDCYIQQYVDRDPGPAVQDFACGTLANDGHKGTDFAVPTEADMADGTTVLAAADGIVRGMRDGMADIRQNGPDAPDIAGTECGNGVLLDHGDGWETQYCHLREGTVTARTGEAVRAGQPLGLIGMSGLASFPHVHFEVRHNGAVVDPFHPEAAGACGPAQSPLWTSAIGYTAGMPIDAGLSAALPSYEDVQAGLPEDGLNAGADAIVLWVFMANVQQGDTLALEITGPDGTFAAHETEIANPQPFRMEAFGRRAPSSGLTEGAYVGSAILSREGTELGRTTVRAALP